MRISLSAMMSSSRRRSLAGRHRLSSDEPRAAHARVDGACPVGEPRAMRALTVLGVVLATVFGAAGCRRDKCVPICEQRAKEIGCPLPERCKTECEDLRKRTVCRAELDTFAACFLAEPKEHWTCDSEGKA